MHELAFNEEGEPFEVPPDVRGWRVRRASEGRGRPMLLHEGGKPLVLRVDASHADLLAAAGPGKYRLEPVDELRRRVDGVPHACTGPLSEDDDGPREDEDGDRFVSSAPARRLRLEDVVCQLLANQTRMVEATIGQLSSVMAGVGNLLEAAHHCGITHRAVVPVATAPAPVPPPAPPQDDDDDEPDEPTEDTAPPSMLPEVLRLIIEKAVERLVPLLVEKVASGELLSGLPLGALLDWRKAAPGAVATPIAAAAVTSWAPEAAAQGAAAVPSMPAMPTSPVASAVAWPTMTAATVVPSTTVPSPPVSESPRMTAASSAPPSPSVPVALELPVAQRVTAPPPWTSASAGAAPNPSPLGAAPAEGSTPSEASSAAGSTTEQDAAAALNAHILQIWRGLSPPERARAAQLIMGFSDAARGAWLAELARLSVPEAIDRARAAIGTPPATAPPHQLSLPSASKE